mmetsp:Transcript_18720/g.17844  ORF Transcript_18720/g.17844 Transcript_18720/m.17844 type:complete len:108 (-) Transcript_18720:1291-1614(-)
MQMYNTQFAKKEDRLSEAGKLFLRNGQIREFCETQFVLERFEKALAFAPLVSIEYWQELAERHAHFLSQNGHEDAPLAAIASNDCDQAIKWFQENEEYEDGKVVKAL